jgi:hypothetical protein
LPIKGVTRSMRKRPAPCLMVASARPLWTAAATAWAATCTGPAGALAPAEVLGSPSGTVVVVVVTDTAAPRVDTPLSVLAGLVSRSAKTSPRTAATSSTATPDKATRRRELRRRSSVAFILSDKPSPPPWNRD